jgi:hypothetical protein
MLRIKRDPMAVVVALLLLALAAAILGGCRTLESAAPVTVTTPPAPVAAPANDADPEVALAWFDLYLVLVETSPGFSPPVASRAFGYAGLTLYEAVVPGLDGYRSLAGQLNGLQPLPQPDSGRAYHWPAVANAALAAITRDLFSHTTAANLQAINQLEGRLAAGYAGAVEAAELARSIGQGYAVAEAIHLWSLTDGGHHGELRNFPDTYIPPAGPGAWEPTPPQFARAMLPSWGENRPFVLESGADCGPPPPPAYSEEPGSLFYTQAAEVYDAVNGLTAEQKAIAEFWADNPGETSTPPGHSMSIVSQVLRQEKATLALAAEAYARTGLAVADAFIGCWNAKYRDNLVRPVTYIRALANPDWEPAVATPPFPEYTSGHSVQSAAAAQVLTDLFGADLAFTDYSHDGRGLAPRSFASFDAFAEEAAISRLYGGIHYRAAIEEGLEQGRCIGRQVSALVMRDPASG